MKYKHALTFEIARQLIVDLMAFKIPG